MLKNRSLLAFATLVAVFSLFMDKRIVVAEELVRSAYKVENLTCSSCLAKIGAELQKIPDAAGMSADLRGGTITVDHLPSLSSEQISDTINSLGYPSTLLSQTEIAAEQASRFSQGNQKAGCGGCGTGAAQPARQWGSTSNGKVITSVYKVDNLSCISCLKAIEEVLQKVQGTRGVNANLSNGLVFVDHVTGTDPDQIAKKITGIGYSARTIGSGLRASQNLQIPQAKGTGSGCGSRSCGASSTSWQQLYNRYVKKNN